MPSVKLISMTSNYEEVLKTACSKPYGAGVSMKIIKDRIIGAGHLSVLEHCYASFEVKCSVRVLGQLTRHRHLSFTCKSARGSKFDTFVMADGLVIDADKSATCATYNKLIAEGVSEENAAYYLPQGIQTNIVVTGNFRAWYEYLPKRLCRRAMPEHRHLAEMIQNELAKACPEVFDKNFMNCGNCIEGSCSFKHGNKSN